MKNLIDDVKRHSPKTFPGYYYIKTQDIYIPYMKITLECLTRKISELNLFFESILKLIDISINDINDISKILGISNIIVKEAIVDMIGINYIYTSENILGLTEKGKNALESKQRVDIQKTYLKDIMVDMITGAVYDADAISVSEPRKRDVLLEGIVQINSDFLESNFREFNEVYQQQQKNNNMFGGSAITSELYKMIDVSYSELHYVENKVYIYKNESSDELMFNFVSDDNDKYKTEFYNQLKEGCRPCQEFFFENSKERIGKIQSNAIELDIATMTQTETIREMIFDDNITNDIKEENFTKKRYTLNDCEYMSYLYNIRELKYDRFFLCSNHIMNLLTPSFCSQLKVLADNIHIFIIYDKNEYKIKDSLAYFFGNTSNNLHLVPCEVIEENFICFDSNLIIYLYENIATAFDRNIIYKQMLCDFDREKVNVVVKNLVEKYDLRRFETKKLKPFKQKKRKKM